MVRQLIIKERITRLTKYLRMNFKKYIGSCTVISTVCNENSCFLISC